MKNFFKKKKWLWQLLNWVIILNFLFQIIYGFSQVFFVLLPPSGTPGPLFFQSMEISHELMIARRLYAIETWIAIVGLAVYLAIVYGRKFVKSVDQTPEKQDSSKDAQ